MLKKDTCWKTFRSPKWLLANASGGIDDNEKPEEAVWREMMEEIGTNNADLHKISSQWINYEIPEETLKHLPWGKTYIGQTQKWFIFNLLEMMKT